MNARHAARAQGFTLIEVMVALAIVAISLAAGARAASSVVNTSQRLSDVVLAQWCADNQLTELRLAGQLPAVGKSPFSCVQLGRNFKGTIKVTPTPNPSFRRVDAIVANDDDRELLTISTVMTPH
ncbi:MAG: type II secretion system minor pseudopilin GspI [Burkholderiaceae bacterium]